MWSESDSDLDLNNPFVLKNNFIKKFQPKNSDNILISSDSDCNDTDSRTVRRVSRRKRKISPRKSVSRDVSPAEVDESSVHRTREISRETSPVEIIETSSVLPRISPLRRVTRSYARRGRVRTRRNPDCLPSTSTGNVRSVSRENIATTSSEEPSTSSHSRKRLKSNNLKNIKKKRIKKEIHDASTDEDCDIFKDIPVVVRVLWKSTQLKKFSVKPFMKLSAIINYFTKTYDLNERLLFFTINDKEIDLNNNTYITLRLNNDVVIEGGALSQSYLSRENVIQEERSGLKLKIQYGERESFFVSLNPEDRMEFVYSETANKLNVCHEQVRIYYDGELVKYTATGSDLGIEDGDVFDVKLVY